MTTMSLLCRLKLLSFVSVASSNELSRSLLIKSNNENERSSFSSYTSFDDVLDETKGNTCRERRYRNIKGGSLVCVAKDVVRYESPSKILLTINEEKSTFSGTSGDISIQKREDSAKRKLNVQRNFSFAKRSSIVSHFPLTTIYHAWMFSKDPCPSMRYLCSQLSNSTTQLFSFANDPTRLDLSLGIDSEGSKSPCRMIISRYENVRSFSSCKKESKPEKCPPEPTCEKSFENICAKQSADPCEPKPSSNECSESSRPCKAVPADPEPICSTSACPNIKDYCQEPDSHKEKFWQMLVCFVMMPLLIITSIYVYSREIEEKKKPRPEYEDVPWMGITHRPFPWGDGKRCFFHNPVKNPIPGEGYEVEDPNAVRKTEPKEARENEN
ncbi:uncharacterized protein LOC105664018 isoform X1 [Megachile rotundata]|uniref:uncharacterized protein LOC105664018 isoform X1 n=1 Tax=Megachile rotundata TaxID=143995 RepID=UPI003FD002A7